MVIRLGDSDNSRPIGESDILQNEVKYQPETSHKDWKTTCGGRGRADKIIKNTFLHSNYRMPTDIRRPPLFPKLDKQD